MQHSSYSSLLRDRGFQCFLWTQFLAAFNDNIFKMIVSIAAVAYTAGNPEAGSRYLALTGAVFVLPFLLLAGWAGQLADRFSKSQVLIVTKAGEILTMVLALFALQAANMPALLSILFLLATQANFFSPAKYGILPEMLPERDLARANALLELSTFVAIVLGGGLGTLLFEHWKQEAWKMGLFLIGLSVLGSLASLGIRRVPASPSREPFHRNPFSEVTRGLRILAGNRPMALTVLAISAFWMIGGLLQLTLVVFVKETLHGAESQIGLLVSALAFGIGLGSLVAGRLSGDAIDLGFVAPAGFLMGLSTLALSAINTQSAAGVCLVLIGFFGGLFIVPLNAFLQEEAPAAEKGRLLATNNFVNMLGVILASAALYVAHDLLDTSANLIFLAAGAFCIAASLYMFSRHLLAHSVRFLFQLLLRLCFRLEIRGQLPARGGAVLVANHVSYADALLISCATPRLIRWITWKTVFDHAPALFGLFRAIPIDLERPREAVQSLLTCRREVEAGELVGIFPEGQITRSGDLLPFKRGYERIAESKTAPAAPIIPISIDGMWGHPLSLHPERSFLGWFRPRVTITIGEPIKEPISPEALQAQVVALSGQDGDTIASRFIAAARERWHSLALADSMGKQLKFGEALTAAQLLRSWIDRHCIGQTHIGLLLPNSVGAALANLATLLSGRTAVNLNFTAGPSFLASAMAQCSIATVFSSRAFLTRQKIEAPEGVVYLEDLLPSFSKLAKLGAFLSARFFLASSARGSDVAAIIFSSGSTGDPKGVELTHRNLLSNMDAVARLYPVSSSDVMLGVLPFFHSFGFAYNLCFPLLRRFPVVLHPNPADAKGIGELSARYAATFLLSTPTFAATYARKCTREQFTHIRYVLVGAEKLRPSIAEEFLAKFGLAMHEGYGCTEMSPVVAVNSPGASRPFSVGRPLPNVQVRIVDPVTMEPLPANSEGMLLVNGPNRMRGYRNQPALTAKVFHEGFYITGDMARLDEEGFLYITGRLSRFSKIAGEMVPHLKIEESLQTLLRDALCLTLGIPDAQRGERLVVLHTATTHTPAQMVEHLNLAGLPALWIPKPTSFFQVESIPTLGSGKTDLRQALTLAQALAAKEAAV
ncbi:MAG: MFS transporter [Acidobacteriota bacterium]|jgi:acyl-[acyl-carrier-protein]-phospholipid O-acyltransferase/long-chain-fatty-acid--[acyl-carrier-protein] ligase